MPTCYRSKKFGVCVLIIYSGSKKWPGPIGLNKSQNIALAFYFKVFLQLQGTKRSPMYNVVGKNPSSTICCRYKNAVWEKVEKRPKKLVQYKHASKIKQQAQFHPDFVINPQLATGLEPTTFQLTFSCRGITFFAWISISPTNYFAPYDVCYLGWLCRDL